jgi:serine protease AprX
MRMRVPKILLLLALCLAMVQLPALGEAPDTGPASAVHQLPLSSGTVDPAVDLPSADPAGEDLVLVQWTEVGTPGIVAAIADTGVTLVQPLAPVSYLVWADAAQTRALRAVDGVRFAGVLPAASRVSGNVTADTEHLRVTLVGAEAPADLPVAPALSRVAPRTFTATDGLVLTIPGGPALAAQLAALPRVYSIADAATGNAPELRDERTNAVATFGTRVEGDEIVPDAAPGDYLAWLTEIGADGSGVIVSNVDGGVDMNHPELSDRIHECIDYVFEHIGCSVGNHDDAIGHGTHTLGITLGTGATGITDQGDGYLMGLGVAPGAKAVVQNAINLAGIPRDILGLGAFADGYRPPYTDAYNLGALVSGNSWGPSGTPQGYDANTREIDSIVRDIDDDAPGDQEMAFVLSVMNGSGGESTQGSPDEAKNLIKVGASGGRQPLRPDQTSPRLDDLCTCTAHGPALDGRMLPDLVAPGQNVVSTKAAQGTLCGLPQAEDTFSPYHGVCTGTSMASPHVTGGYALFVDWYRTHVVGDDAHIPSPALVKAALINGAEDLAALGTDAVDADGEPLGHRPNNQQGWGRLSLGSTIGGWELGYVHVDQAVAFTDSGESHTLHVEAVDPDQPLKATLVWTDALGPEMPDDPDEEDRAMPAWVNDLNLVVEDADGRTYLGNVFSEGYSTTGGEADEKNNVENVFLSEPGGGTFTVTVDAANIIGKASPNVEEDAWQDFALVITNAREVTDPTDPTDPGPTDPTDPGPATVTRHGGQDRIETAAAISRATFDTAETVVIARADVYADALAGAPYAVHSRAPLLLSGTDRLAEATAAEITRLGAGRAVLLGGEAALSEQVGRDLEMRGIRVERIWDRNRFGTAARIMEALPDSEEVFVAEGHHDDLGRGWPDALSASGLAAVETKPILLVTRERLPQETEAMLSAQRSATIVGGPAAVSDEVRDEIAARSATITRLFGATRYETSAAVAGEALRRGVEPRVTWAATGRAFADGLVASAAAGFDRGALVLVDGVDLAGSPPTAEWVRDHADSIRSLRLAGGNAAISADVEARLRSLLEG